MTIFVDDRAGSRDLVDYINKDHVLTRLDFGDVMFTGNGPRGVMLIGLEHKTISDVAQCIDNGRFAGKQLPGMLETYDFSYLMVEGVWRSDPGTGVLQTHRRGKWTGMQYGNRAWMYSEVMGWLNTMTAICGLRVIQTGSKVDSGRTINNLHSWWQKPWNQHHAHLAMDMSRIPKKQRCSVELVPGPQHTYVRKVANLLPGIGWGRSELVDKKFKTVRDMVNADLEEWTSIRGIGKKTAKTVKVALQGEE